MDICKEYINVCGDKAVIQVNDCNNISIGYYAGSIKPYETCWERARFYKTKESAKQTAKSVLSENFTIVMISELIRG